MKKQWIAFVLVTAMAGGGYWWWAGHRELPADLVYTQERLERAMIVKSVSANGTLNPVVLVSVGTQVSGTVRELKADFNDHVAAGQILAVLDPSLFDAQIAQSEANVANIRASVALALANEQRARELFGKQFISRQEMDQSIQAATSAKAQLAQAQAQLRQYRTNKNYSVIRSPVSGVVVDRQIDIGQTVAASFQTPTLFKIAQDLRRMQIDASFAEADIGAIRVGQPVKFTVDAFADRTFGGRVRQIRLNATTTSNVVTYDVVVAVDNPQQILLPGMTAYVTVIEDRRPSALAVPNAALRFRPSFLKNGDAAARKKHDRPKDPAKGRVFVLRDGKPRPAVISIGISDGKYTEVTGGALTEGERVIVDENRSVRGSRSSAKAPMRIF